MKKLLAVLVLTSLLMRGGVLSAAPIISITPSASTINEGQSQTLTIRLSQPITATPPGNYVTLSLTTSNPESSYLSPTSVTFTASEWNTDKTFTLYAINNDTYNDSKNLMVLGRTSSGSSYYNNFIASARVYVNNTTPAPLIPTVTEEENESRKSKVIQPSSDSVYMDALNNSTGSTIRYGTTGQSQAGVSKTNQAGEEAKSNWNRMAFLFVPDNPTLLQRISGYLILVALIMSAALLPLLIVRRAMWWQRQKSAHVRWKNRNKHTTQRTNKAVKVTKKITPKTKSRPKLKPKSKRNH